jgi:hypothetical protein
MNKIWKTLPVELFREIDNYVWDRDYALQYDLFGYTSQVPSVIKQCFDIVNKCTYHKTYNQTLTLEACDRCDIPVAWSNVYFHCGSRGLRDVSATPKFTIEVDYWADPYDHLEICCKECR